VAGVIAERRAEKASVFARFLEWPAARWVSLVAFFALWEAVAHSGTVTSFQLPSLEMVAVRIWEDTLTGDMPINLGLTLYRALTGFVLAGIPGIALGILVTRIAPVRWLFDPLISVGFPMPKIAFIPVIVLWFGFHDMSKISIVVFDAIFPVVTATIAGTEGVDRHLLWSARNLGASERELLWQVALPAAMPQILTGLQVALPIALIVAIIAEMNLGGQGLGGGMITAFRFADSPGVFAALVEIAVAGIALIKGMAWVRRRLLVWHQETRHTAASV
jgi:ABC-type nitrate/sulfonate/bicarbonate transport system permease component